MEKIDVRGLTYSDLEKRLLDLGEKKFRASQVFSWIHEKGISSFADMSNISKDLKNKLNEHFFITPINMVTKQVDSVDGTIKYLFELSGEYIETVVMKYKDHNSICVSSQAGCLMGCTFCASGKNGLSRNLSAGEIISQFYYAQNDMDDRISHIVYMGTGEPLDNFNNVVKSIEILSEEKGKNLSKRNITLSTCGIAPNIKKLADLNYPVTLALSLHSTSDENRKKTMPITNKYSIKDCMEAMEYYYSKTKRRVSFEFALIKGVNDSLEESTRLTTLIKSRNFLAHVNIILVNNVVENYYTKPSKESVKLFIENLKKYGIETTLRRSVGENIDGACGQLRLKTDRSRKLTYK